MVEKGANQPWQKARSVRKELMFTVRATINSGDQPFYERTYKVRTQ